MAIIIMESVVTRACATKRMVRSGSTVVVGVNPPTPANLSHARHQQDWSPWIMAESAKGKPALRRAYRDPRAAQAGRPDGLGGVSGSRLANTARRAVLARRRGVLNAPLLNGRSARVADSRTTGFSSAFFRAR
jgi:hypothetical protein